MASVGPNSGDIFDVKKIRRLVELMKEHDLAEIDLRQSDQRIRLRRGGEPEMTMGAAQPYNPPPMAQTVPPAAAAAPAADSASIAVIKSPMIGTYYSAANPESKPFVKVGDHVGPETVIGIIEAMKVFNEIPAEISGQITAVLVENGTPVEFNQPLYKVDTKK